jgi:hypothetical protein
MNSEWHIYNTELNDAASQSRADLMLSLGMILVQRVTTSHECLTSECQQAINGGTFGNK